MLTEFSHLFNYKYARFSILYLPLSVVFFLVFLLFHDMIGMDDWGELRVGKIIDSFVVVFRNNSNKSHNVKVKVFSLVVLLVLVVS